MLELFKTYVDNTERLLNSREKHGTPYTTDETKPCGPVYHKTIDPIIERIKNVLRPGKESDAISKNLFTQFRNELIYRYVLYNDPIEDYLSIVNAFADSMRELAETGYTPLSNKEAWIEAIGLMKDYIGINTYSFHKVNINELRRDYPKHYDIATSAKFLTKRYSCTVEIDLNGVLSLTSGIDKVTKDIEKRISRIGGLTLIEHIFKRLHDLKLFNTYVNRYFIGRVMSMTSFEREPDVPIGYLLNVSVKYLFKKKHSTEIVDSINEILEISTLLCNALYQSQLYSIWEPVFAKGDKMPYLIRDISIYDSVFSFAQGDLIAEVETLSDLFDFIPPDEFFHLCSFSLHDFVTFLSEVDRLTKDSFKPITIYKSTISKSLKISADRIDRLFEVLSHKSGKVNKQYFSPSDYISINFDRKPFIELNSNSYLFLNRTWSAKAFYESIAAVLRVRPNFEADVGTSIENSLKRKCLTKGVTFLSGKYNQSKVNGECDLIIEGETDIILFEIKKKVLTHRSKSGFDIDIVIDLKKALLDSQVQASRTELLLLADKKVKLKDKQHEYVLPHADKRIHRVSVTHLDFRGFHDRLFITGFLETLLMFGLKPITEDPAILEQFEQIEQKREILIKQYNSFCNYYENHEHSPYFFSCFLNVDHLILMLNLSNSNEQFIKYFKSTLHINATGSLNFYREFFVANALMATS